MSHSTCSCVLIPSNMHEQDANLCKSNQYKQSFSKSKCFRVHCVFDHFSVQSGWSSLRVMCQSHRWRVHGSLDLRHPQEQRTVSCKAGLCPVMPMIKQSHCQQQQQRREPRSQARLSETASDTTNLWWKHSSHATVWFLSCMQNPEEDGHTAPFLAT